MDGKSYAKRGNYGYGTGGMGSKGETATGTYGGARTGVQKDYTAPCDKKGPDLAGGKSGK